ncbi:MAG TPA: reverse transcriptase domain-containing protein [Polyangiaceae bacterium]|nr:reverse transcriptase domain-containing protein [Polyangiaceae bacterium]
MNRDVLVASARLAAKSKGAGTPGVDGVRLNALTPAELNGLVSRLHADLCNDSYTPADLKVVVRREGKKVRRFMIATATDGVVQRALRMGMEPAVARALAPNYYSRRGLGPHAAVDAVLDALEAADELTGAGAVHIIKADVEKYFDTIDHARLEGLIRSTFRGRRTMHLIRAFIEQGQFRRRRGVAQGSALSPLLAGWFMSPVDWYFHRRKTVFFARYVDDVALVVPGDVVRAHENLAELERQVHRLGLSLNKAKTTVVPVDKGIGFLGFHICRGAHGVEVVPSERSIGKLQQKLDEVPDDGSTWQNLHLAKARWAAYLEPFVPDAMAIGNRAVEVEWAARLQQRPVQQTLGTSQSSGGDH